MKHTEYGELKEISFRFEKGFLAIQPYEIQKMLLAAEGIEEAFKAIQAAKRIAKIKFDSEE